MTELINDTILDDFQDITLYDIRSFLSSYVNFTDNHYSNMVNYFSGASDVSPTESLNLLAALRDEYKKLVDIIILNYSSLDRYDFWVLTEYIEDIAASLDTANNMSRWLRSALTTSGYKQQVVLDYMTSQGQKLEDIEKGALKSSDPDSWVNTALDNGLREEDYNSSGGKLIKVVYKNNASLSLNSVIDNIDTADRTYGLDIKQFITFTADSDLEVLSYRDTLLQSMKILTDLRKGDDPAFPERGLNIKGILGNSAMGIAYPVLFRQLAENFSTDDGFKSFTILDVKKKTGQDASYVEFQVETRAGEVFNNYIEP